MSKRCALTSLLLLSLSAASIADTPQHSDTSPVLPLGESGWEMFRPVHRSYTMFDYEYTTNDLRSDHSHLGFRFKTSSTLTLELRIDPLTRSSAMIGPVYDMDIGAAMFSLGFRF
jgi:hypothetical protein